MSATEQRACPEKRGFGPPEHHGRMVRRTIGVIRAVTRRASHLARRRQGGVEKYVLPQSRHRGERLDGGAKQTNRFRIFAGRCLRLRSEDGGRPKAGGRGPP